MSNTKSPRVLYFEVKPMTNGQHANAQDSINVGVLRDMPNETVNAIKCAVDNLLSVDSVEYVVIRGKIKMPYGCVDTNYDDSTFATVCRSMHYGYTPNENGNGGYIMPNKKDDEIIHRFKQLIVPNGIRPDNYDMTHLHTYYGENALAIWRNGCSRLLTADMLAGYDNSTK